MAAMPPTAIWPSPPTLVRLARLARTKPRPTSASDDARLIEAADRVRRAERPSTKAAIAFGTDTPVSGDQQQADQRGATRRPATRHQRAQGRSAKPRRGPGGRCSVADEPSVMRRAPPSTRRSLACARARRAVAHDPAAVDHDDAIRDGEQFVELGGDQQHRDAALAGGADMAVDRLDRADVEPARRLRGEEETSDWAA